MPKLPLWSHLPATGTRLVPFGRDSDVELRVRHARQFTADLVAQGQHARDHLGAVLGEFIARSRNEALRRIVRSGADRQLRGLGLVTKADLAAFERRLSTPSVSKTARPNKKTPRGATG